MRFLKAPAMLLLCMCALVGQAQEGRAGESAPQADTVSSQVATGNAGTEKVKKVCKTSVVTGSRFKQRVCYTQAEWDEIDLAHQDKMRDIDRQPVGHREP